MKDDDKCVIHNGELVCPEEPYIAPPKDKTTKNIVLFVAIILLMATFATILPGLLFGGGGSTIIVDENGNGHYTTVQAAIDNAVPGNEIHIWDGDYAEELFLDVSGLIIYGNGTSTRLTYSVIIRADDVNNITIKNLWFDVYPHDGIGGEERGIQLSSCENIKIKDCKFTEGTVSIRVSLSKNIVVENCTFENAFGSAFYETSGDNTYISDCYVNNTGGGITVGFNDGETVIRDCGVYNVSSVAYTVRDSDALFLNNTAINASIGINTNDISDVTIIGNIIDDVGNSINIGNEGQTLIVYNTISNCSENVITADHVVTTTIKWNNFIDNDPEFDFWSMGTNVTFNDTEENGGGNYYSNWNTPDTDMDGFVDNPFTQDFTYYNFTSDEWEDGVLIDHLPHALPVPYPLPVPDIEEPEEEDDDTSVYDTNNPIDLEGPIIPLPNPQPPEENLFFASQSEQQPYKALVIFILLIAFTVAVSLVIVNGRNKNERY